MDLLDCITTVGRVSPDATAYISGDRELTYGELLRRSDAVAAHLVGTIPDDGSPVMVLGHKEPEMVIAFLGAVKSGHPYVPVDVAVPPQRVQRMASVAGARITLDPEAVATLPDAGDESIVPAHCQVKPADPFYILFTSGSTGEPKGVIVVRSCLENLVPWLIAEHELKSRAEVLLNQAAFTFDVSMGDLYLGLASGATVYSVTRDQVENPKRLFQALPHVGATIWSSTPSFVSLCLAEPTFSAEMLPRLRRFILAGEILGPRVVEQLLDRFPEAQVWNLYGPTEATVYTTSVRIDREMLAKYSLLPIGYPMPGTIMPVVDADLHPVPVGERGEITIIGPNVSLGYVGRPDLTSRAFFQRNGQRGYRTGDLGYVRDGMLFCEGRMDSQIKLHGYRIELGDVETNLRALEGVRDAVVVPATKDGAYEFLAAFVIMSDGIPAAEFSTARELRTQLRERLPSYMVPRRIVFLESFPMNVNGKADRQKLAELLK